MLTRTAPSLARQALRSSISQACARAPSTTKNIAVVLSTTKGIPSALQHAFLGPRNFHASTTFSKGITPDSEDPQPKDLHDGDHIAVPADISMDEYHELSDHYMDQLVSKLEQLQEEKENVDVEFSAGVLTVAFPPAGTYVVNKQPPNKQIWLSSPITGPKRYDWVFLGDSMHQKEGQDVGDWVYLRDSSTLSDLIRKELGVTVGLDERLE
ncbi:MAG: Mitochondrial chaperone Frataxin [Pycnora praestabilis]|nr:MAG: Mitochondrial chaperone Frataxin [Pycnora praestabilis]